MIENIFAFELRRGDVVIVPEGKGKHRGNPEDIGLYEVATAGGKLKDRYTKGVHRAPETMTDIIGLSGIIDLPEGPMLQFLNVPGVDRLAVMR